MTTEHDTIEKVCERLRGYAGTDTSIGRLLAQCDLLDLADRLERINAEMRAKINAYKLAGEGFSAALQKRIDRDDGLSATLAQKEEAEKGLISHEPIKPYGSEPPHCATCDCGAA